MISERWDVVVVPFPFTDRPMAKRRPGLTLSQHAFDASGHTVLVMITTKVDPAWPGDTRLADHAAAGLPAARTVRLKLFTLDNRLITRIVGRPSSRDRNRVAEQLGLFLT